MAFWEVLFDITKNLMYSYLNVRWVLFENFISRLDWNFSYACSVDRLRLAGLSQGGNGVWCASLWSPLSFPRCQRFEINTNEPCPCKCCDKTPITNLRTAPHELSTLSWFRFRRFRGGGIILAPNCTVYFLRFSLWQLSCCCCWVQHVWVWKWACVFV